MSFLFFSGCVASKPIEIEKPVVHDIEIVQEKEIAQEEVNTIVHISQDPDVYTKTIQTIDLNVTQEKFESQYFRAWTTQDANASRNSVDWAFKTYNIGNAYGENLQPLTQDFFEAMKTNSNFAQYSTLNKKAITLKDVNLRAFPTNKPLLMNPDIAGEGFPFDYLQNSAIAANKPIFATHYSKDKQWIHVFSSFAYGWIPADELVFLQSDQTELWQKAQQLLMIKDGVSIYSLNGDFLFKSKIGTIFALIDENDEYFTILAVSSYKTREPLFVKAKISKDVASKGFLEFNGENMKNVTNELLKSNYGWGGMYGQRDCSSTIKDMFAPFGIWLPRNSYQQSKVGDVVLLEGLSTNEKISIIKEKGVPFKTLLYKKGHIVLYVGVVNDEITIFQNVWGIKTKKDGMEGRLVIGKTIFSTLNLGDNLNDYDVNASMLENLKSINTLY